MSAAEKSTVFVGALQPTTTQAFLTSYFANFGQVVNLNLRQNGLGECVGFGFVQMSCPAEVNHILANCPHYFMGKLIDVKPFKKTTDDQKIFVGGLNLETSDDSLRRYFKQFGEVDDAGVRLNLTTGRSRGFGIVTFADLRTVDQVLALPDVVIDGKKVEVKRLDRTAPVGERSNANVYTNDYLETAYSNNKNKLFVGGMHLQSDENSLRNFYAQFGEIKACNIALDKTTGKRRGFGFVQYEDEESVERCMAARPHVIDNHPVETKRALTNEDAKNMFTVMKLFVGGLKGQHSAEKLREYFSAFGNVSQIQMSRGETPEGHKGYAFIIFDDYDPVDKVIATKPHVIEGSRVDCTKGLSKDEMTKLEEQRQRDMSSREQRTMANQGMGGGSSGAYMQQYGGGYPGSAAASAPFGYGMSAGYGYGGASSYGAASSTGGSSTNWLGINTGSYGYGYSGGSSNSSSAMNSDGMAGARGSAVDSAARMRSGGSVGSNRSDSATSGYGAQNAQSNGARAVGSMPSQVKSEGPVGSASDNRIRGPAFKQLLQSAEVSAEAVKTLELENLLDSSLVMSLTTDEFMNLPLRMGDRKRIEYALKALSEA